MAVRKLTLILGEQVEGEIEDEVGRVYTVQPYGVDNLRVAQAAGGLCGLLLRLSTPKEDCVPVPPTPSLSGAAPAWPRSGR